MPKSSPFHSSIAAAYLMLGKEVLPDWPHWPASPKDSLSLTNAGRSQSYEMLRRLRELLPRLEGKPGRPAVPPPPEAALLAVRGAALDYVMRRPGSVNLTEKRAYYSDGFRCFVLGLLSPGQAAEGFTSSELAEAVGIPLATLKQWLQAGLSVTKVAKKDADWLRDSHLQQILTLYQAWNGAFTSFCEMVRQEHRLNYSKTYIGNFLHLAGVRHRRGRRSQQAPWTYNTFRCLFPGAQWLGDGTSLTIGGIAARWGEEKFTFNLELVLDVASNALVGLALSDAENEEVVIQAYQEAVTTTGEQPLALSLDNRYSNHTDRVAAALGADTELLPTTLGRGQSKAPLEGAFGLFAQELPELVIEGSTAREKARAALKLVFTAWARGRNGRPRKKLGHQTPTEFYKAARPTELEIEDARKWIQQLKRRQEQLRRTREARADRVKLELLRLGMEELGIADPDGRLATDLAFYSRDAIVNGLAIFRAKQELGTLPPGAELNRYLGGIIRNCDAQAELELTSRYYLENRRRLKDLSLTSLVSKSSELESAISNPLARIQAYITRSLEARFAIDHTFWSTQAIKTLTDLSATDRLVAYHAVTRRIAASFKADRTRKQSLLAGLAKAVTED